MRRTLLLGLVLSGCATGEAPLTDSGPSRDARADARSTDAPAPDDAFDARAEDTPAPPDAPPSLDAPPSPDAVAPPDTSDARDAISPADRASPPDVAAPFDAPVEPDVMARPDVPVPPDVPVVCPAPPAMPAPDDDAWRMGAPAPLPVTTRMVTAGGHRDLYLVGPSNVAELAVRLDWGGTVVFFGQRNVPASNVIDGNDTGRELQLALYDPTRLYQRCARDASCAGPSPCGASITYLGWNPVQGGDECNRGAQATGALADNRLVVDVRPLHWNPDWEADDCRSSACTGAGLPVGVTYRLEFAFVHPNVVEVAMQVTSEETITHPSNEQEFPTLYVGNGRNSTDLPLLLDSDGTPVSVDMPANDGFTFRNFESPLGWVTWQHAARDYGVGLAMDHRTPSWQGWAGSGSGAPYFHNVRARQSFGLGAGAAVRGRAYMVLGSFDTVRGLMGETFARRGPFGVLDAPARDVSPAPSTAGRVRVAGWALDDRSIAQVVPRVDGVEGAPINRDRARPDVCGVYPNYAGCPAVGYDGDVALPADGCTHLLEVLARDADGNTSVLGRRLVR